MKRSDPAGSSALLMFNFSAEAQSIPVAGDSQPWRLLLWTGDQVYGGSSKHRPLETLAPASTSDVSLAAFEAVIYVTLTRLLGQRVRPVVSSGSPCPDECRGWRTIRHGM